jgi:tetratricopeptide (TPR) repeat protein
LCTSAVAADWDRAVALYKKGDYRRALAEFQGLVQSDPSLAAAWYYIGLCEFNLKRYDRVELPLSRAIDLLEVQSPGSAQIEGAWYAIGISHYLLGQYERAIDPLKRYIELASGAGRAVEASARRALGRAYFSLGRYDEAAAFLQASALAPERSRESASDQYYLGAIYFKRGDDERAISALREAVKLNPEDASALELLAESLIRRASKSGSSGAWLEAAQVGRQLESLRDDAKAASILGRAYLGARQFEKAIAPLEKLARSNPEDGQAWFYYGVALSRSKEWRKAMEALEMAIQLAPDSLPALLELGYVYESDKQYQQALRVYEKALSLSNDAAIRESLERVRALAIQNPR